MRARGPVLSAAVTLVLVSAGALSATAHTISVIRPDTSDAVLTESLSRLSGELRMYGFEVKLLDSQPGTWDADEPPVELGGPAGGIGIVVLLRAAGQASAKIWIAEKASSSVRITVSIDDVDAASLLAMRAADLLRASLRDLPESKDGRAAPGLVDSAAVVVRADAPRHRGFDRWSFQVGASMLWETGDLGAGLAPTIRLGRRLSPQLALALAVDAPVSGQKYTTSVATARLRQELGQVAIAWRVVGRQRLSLDLFQGLGVMHLSLRGEAGSPWIGQTASAWTAAATTGACLVFHLSTHMGVTVALAALFALPRPVLDIADVSYSAHLPLLLTSAGFQYAF